MVQVSREKEVQILGYPSKEIIPGQRFWDIKQLNDRVHEMTYAWQNQAPVSANRFLTIEYLLKDWFPVAFFFNGYRKQRKFMRIEAQ